MFLGRHNVTPSTEILCGPFGEPVTIEIVSMAQVESNTPATMCWLSFDKKQCRPGLGYPLEPGTKIEIDMLPDQILYCVTQDVGLIGYAVKGYRGR